MLSCRLGLGLDLDGQLRTWRLYFESEDARIAGASVGCNRLGAREVRRLPAGDAKEPASKTSFAAC